MESAEIVIPSGTISGRGGLSGGEIPQKGSGPSSDKGVITLIISIAAVIFSLGTLISDMIRNRNLLIHDLQTDGQVFHRTLIQLDRLHCSSFETKGPSSPGDVPRFVLLRSPVQFPGTGDPSSEGGIS